MDITYQYMKIRNCYGRQPMFCEQGPALCDSIPVNSALHKEFILRNPVHTPVQNTPTYWHNDLNTIRAEYTTSGCNHAEGGWPRDVNVLDPEATQRYRRKVEKDDGYIHCIMSLAAGMDNLVLQNNAIDMYQTYYTELAALPELEVTSCRTVNVYRDGAGARSGTAPQHRPVGSICWRPDGANLFAVTYVDVDFNRNPRAPISCCIWDIDNANFPETTITPPHPLLDLQYNPRNIEEMAGALMNGQVALWDRRAGGQAPVSFCPPHVAHRDLVCAVKFINAKNGKEFFSSGPDGVCKWWDLRDMSEPIDEMIIDFIASANEEQSMARAHGVSCLEFEATIPTRFMAGTENGLVVSANRKGKTALEKLTSKISAHLGPVWKVERNPGFLKNFLTIGDWTARVWSEECRESAVLWTAPHRHRVMDGAWSPARLSLVLLTLSSGRLALWDLLRRQAEPVLTVQVCEEPLRRISAHDAGTMVACGSSTGNIYLLELARSLCDTSKQEKAMMTAVLERESKRERILEARLREIRLKARTADERSPAASLTDLDGTVGDKDLLEATAEYQLLTKKELAAM